MSSTACLFIWLNRTSFCSYPSSSPVYPGFRFPQDGCYLAGNFFLLLTCCGSHSHFGVCANIQPSFSPGNHQRATILIREHLHSHNYHHFQALHQHSNIFQSYQIRDVWTANSKWNQACGSFIFTWSLLLKAGFRRLCVMLQQITLCSKSKQKEPGLRSSRDWIPYPFINFKASISV